MSRDNVDTVTSEKEYHNSENGKQLFSTHPNYTDIKINKQFEL